MRWTLMTLLLVSACADKDDASPTDSEPLVIEPFCESYAEADTTRVDEGDGNVTSGQILGQLVQSVSADHVDPQYVSFVDYLLENVDSGGVPTVGRTDGLGTFTATVGPGTWRFKTSGHQGVYECISEFEFQVVAGQVTRACVDMNCR